MQKPNQSILGALSGIPVGLLVYYILVPAIVSILHLFVLLFRVLDVLFN
jgi:hypothetical protein